MLPPQRPTPPAAQGGMAVEMPPQGGPHSAPQGPPGFGQEGMPDPVEGVVQILAELQNAGVDVRSGPNGTIILTGIPAEILAQFQSGEAPNPAG